MIYLSIVLVVFVTGMPTFYLLLARYNERRNLIPKDLREKAIAAHYRELNENYYAEERRLRRVVREVLGKDYADAISGINDTGTAGYVAGLEVSVYGTNPAVLAVVSPGGAQHYACSLSTLGCIIKLYCREPGTLREYPAHLAEEARSLCGDVDKEVDKIAFR